MLEDIVSRALKGMGASIDEAMELNSTCTNDQLCEAADRVRRERTGSTIDTCSIVNARSGRCSEDCKWCAQSRHYHTGIEEYDLIDDNVLEEAANTCAERGVHRFSMVTSGRRMTGKALEKACAMFRAIAVRHPQLQLCASMGLLGLDDLKKLREAGVSRYHCNLETSASYFPTLCTTHTHADKLRTIAAAREAGMQVCSGGIIGMGEGMRERLEMCAQARDAGAVSIPVNILSPIPGTALEHTPLIEEEEIVRTAALMRLVAPDTVLRFAGGRARLSQATTERMLRGGINGAMIGDLLTTAGSSVENDFALFKRLGYTKE